ncbi:AMP-binding protein [Streptomyces sp. NPDC014776]|uniref:AMP-binding protein n=1 Tax=unclassified Streptomyces TaxID=2593676 RepID=UPI0036FBA648
MLDGCTPWPEVFVDRYWAAGQWRGHTLDNLLRDRAVRYGPRTALVHGATRLTYAQLNRRVERMAAGFRLRGLRPGQRIVVQLPSVPEFVVTVFALMRAGTYPVLCPLSHGTAEVCRVVRIAEAAGYVGPAVHGGVDHIARVAEIAGQGPFLRRAFLYEPAGTSSPYGGLRIDASGCHYFPLGSVDSPPERPLVRGADQVAFFLTAEGTGAEPLLVPRTHDDYACQVRGAAEAVALTEDDVCLAALPAESPLALGCPGIVGTLFAGGTVVLAEDPDPGACLALIARERVTLTSVTPAVVRDWLDVLPTVRADVSSLRLVQLGGGPPDRATALRVREELGCRPQQVFALAEGPLTLTRPGDPDEAAFTTQGRPLSPDDQIRIVGADGEDVPDGETGQLLARGPAVVRGYYRAPEHNARAFTADGHLRTGVRARRTPDGDLVVTGSPADAASAGR